MEIITGIHPIQESIRSGKIAGTLYIAQEQRARYKSLINDAKKQGIPVQIIPARELDNLAGKKSHRGLLLEVQQSINAPGKSLPEFIENFPPENPLVCVLDGVTDPHNLGAVIRSADQFAVDLLLLPSRRSSPVTKTVAETSAGASNYLPICTVVNLNRSLDILKEAGFWIYGADMSGIPAHQTDLRGPVALVMGSEGRGISRLLSEKCDFLIQIPSKGNIDSFNVSVAAGILLYEIRRQQGF